MKIKSGDTVVVVSGKDKGKKGKVLKVFPKENRVIVEGVNITVKHQKPMGPTMPGGRIEKESPINAPKVMYFCDKDKQGVRVGYKLLNDGSKVRVCKKCGEVLDK